MNAGCTGEIPNSRIVGFLGIQWKQNYLPCVVKDVNIIDITILSLPEKLSLPSKTVGEKLTEDIFLGKELLPSVV